MVRCNERVGWLQIVPQNNFSQGKGGMGIGEGAEL